MLSADTGAAWHSCVSAKVQLCPHCASLALAEAGRLKGGTILEWGGGRSFLGRLWAGDGGS